MRSNRPIAQVRRDIDEVRRLLGSRGWEVMRSLLAQDIEVATRALASRANLETTELHYRRGALNAALSMSRLPEAVLEQLENELALHPDAVQQAGSSPPTLKPAKAGKTG